jgi:hypothetical protein
MKKRTFPRKMIILVIGLTLACAPLDTIREILASGSSPDAGEGLNPLPPLPETVVPTGRTIYVTMSGNDGNDCLTAASACRTLPAAIGKAEWLSEIQIAPGTYDGSVRIARSLFLTGQPSSSTRIVQPSAPSPTAPNVAVAGGARVQFSNLQIDGNPAPLDSSTAHGLTVETGSTAVLLDVSIRDNRGNAVNNMGTLYSQGGSVTGNDSGISNLGTADIRGTEIRGNGGSNFGSFGLLSRGDATLNAVSVRENDGAGILHYSGLLSVTGGEVGANHGDGLRIEGGTAQVSGTPFDGNTGAGVMIRGGSVSLSGIRIEHGTDGLSVAGGEARAEEAVIRQNSGYGVRVSAGRLSLRDAEVTGNAYGLEAGGSGEADVNGGVFESNANAGLVVDGGRLTAENSRSNNNGFGLRVYSGEAAARNVAFNDNTSAGVRNQEGRLTLRDALIMDNREEGLLQYGDPGDSRIPETLLERAAIARNGGDGINLQEGTAEATNLTVSGNGMNGIALSSAEFTLAYGTVVYNAGQAGIYVGGSARMSSANSIIVSNRSVLGDCYTHPTGVFEHTVLDLGCRPGLDADYLRLGPLTEIGGTFVHPLGAGSPALDAARGPCPAEDQRGVARPAGSACDVGAFEYDPLATASPASGTVTGTLVVTANCRVGPGTVYDIFTTLQKGQSVKIEGQNDIMPKWWWVLLPSASAHCWVSDETVEVEGPAADLPVVAAPPLPTPEPFQPNACYVFNDKNQPVCTAPCPPNAQPGGACQP